MMECLMMFPVDMFKLELLPYLTVHDIVRLDSAFMNHEYRPQFLDKISGGILRGDNGSNSFFSLTFFLVEGNSTDDPLTTR